MQRARITRFVTMVVDIEQELAVDTYDIKNNDGTKNKHVPMQSFFVHAK